MRQRGPDEADQLARHSGCRDLRWTPSSGQTSIGPMYPMLSGPGTGDRVGRRIALSLVQLWSDVRMMPIVSRGFK